MDIEQLKEFFNEGIVKDLIYAIRHYFIWRTIGENYGQIKKVKNESFENLMGELQSSSQDLAIIRLSKIYDNQSNKHQIRCIPEILNLELFCTSHFPIYTANYCEFNQILELNQNVAIPSIIPSPDDFSKFFKDLMQDNELKRKINNLKFLRNKTIAHNEHGVHKNSFQLTNFWDEFLVLICFSKSFISLFGNIFLDSHYFQLKYKNRNEIHFSTLSELYWLIDEIENKVGRDKLVQWWA